MNPNSLFSITVLMTLKRSRAYLAVTEATRLF